MTISDYAGGTVPIARWQLKLAQRVAGFEPGRYMLIFDMPTSGTVEPSWSVQELGKIENYR